MVVGTSQKSGLFSANPPFKASKAALGVILATVFLAAILAFSTLQNINRASQLMERFLLQKGETVIRAVEAGMRTSLLHHMEGTAALSTLLSESSRENDVAYIVIVERNGNVLARTDEALETGTFRVDIPAVLAADEPVAFLNEEAGIFMISKRLTVQPLQSGRSMMDSHRLGVSVNRHLFADSIIAIGLFTEMFDQARRQDVEHAILMGALLFLVGSAGLYGLFLYQGMRVARLTLANMKLYTDNVVESIPVGILTLDSAGKIVSCNRNAEKIFGRSLQTLRGRGLSDALPGCVLDTKGIRTTALDHSVEFRMEDGRRLPLTISWSPLHNTQGEPIGTVLVIRDMTMIRNMEQQLERSRRMVALGKMAAGIAHEIRNPLGTLRGFAHYFGSRPEATNKSREYAELMVSEVDRLNRNVSGLLQFARPREPSFVTVSLEELIRKTLALMESDFARRELHVHWQCATPIQLEADPDQLLQVLMNLLKNSVSATAPGGEVSLSGTEDEGQVRITVTDNGSGMTDQERERMFDPFFTTKKTGTGLGLAVSHQIIEQHQGSLVVETVPGEGTSITIVLPKHR